MLGAVALILIFVVKLSFNDVALLHFGYAFVRNELVAAVAFPVFDVARVFTGGLYRRMVREVVRTHLLYVVHSHYLRAVLIKEQIGAARAGVICYWIVCTAVCILLPRERVLMSLYIAAYRASPVGAVRIVGRFIELCSAAVEAGVPMRGIVVRPPACRAVPLCGDGYVGLRNFSFALCVAVKFTAVVAAPVSYVACFGAGRRLIFGNLRKVFAHAGQVIFRRFQIVYARRIFRLYCVCSRRQIIRRNGLLCFGEHCPFEYGHAFGVEDGYCNFLV